MTGLSERTSPRGRTRIGGSWPVVRLWELEAETLLASPDVGLIPWVPLTRTTLSPDQLLTRCRDRLIQVPDPKDRAGLIAVTQILAALSFPDRRFLELFGGTKVMIESPILDEVKELIREQLRAQVQAEVRAEVREQVQAEVRAEVREQARAEARAEVREQARAEARAQVLRENVLTALEARFGSVPPERVAALDAATDEARLRTLLQLAATCPDVDAFVVGLTATP